MTLGEFRIKTAHMDAKIDIFVGERLTEFRFGLVNSVSKKTIRFTEDPDGSGECAIDEVLVLEED